MIKRLIQLPAIIETPQGDIKAIEVKSTNMIQSVHLHGLRSFQALIPLAKLACVCLAPHRRQIGNITIMPWQDVLKWIKK